MSAGPPFDPSLPTCAPRCIDNGRRCFGESVFFPGRPDPGRCCDPDYQCVRRNANFGQCRRIGSVTPTLWDGTVLRCNLPESVPESR